LLSLPILRFGTNGLIAYLGLRFQLATITELAICGVFNSDRFLRMPIKLSSICDLILSLRILPDAADVVRQLIGFDGVRFAPISGCSTGTHRVSLASSSIMSSPSCGTTIAAPNLFASRLAPQRFATTFK
jgi:hypothetical protein